MSQKGNWVANILVDFSEISFVIFSLLRVTGKHTQADKLIVCLQTVHGDDLEKMATYWFFIGVFKVQSPGRKEQENIYRRFTAIRHEYQQFHKRKGQIHLI